MVYISKRRPWGRRSHIYRAVPRSKLAWISDVYLSKYRATFLLKTLLRSLMYVTGSSLSSFSFLFFLPMLQLSVACSRLDEHHCHGHRHKLKRTLC